MQSCLSSRCAIRAAEITSRHERGPASELDTASAPAGADPGAHPPRWRRVGRGARPRARRLGDHGSPRPRAARAGGSRGACPRRRTGALRLGDVTDRDRLEPAGGPGQGGQGGNRGACGADGRERLDDLRRRLVERARAGASDHAGTAQPSDARHELAGRRLRADRRACARRRVPRRARPAPADDRRALDRRVPRRTELRPRLRVGDGRDARRGPHHLAPPTGGRASTRRARRPAGPSG